MSFVVSGLPAEPFQPLFGLSDEALAAQGAIRVIADDDFGYPCRVLLEDARRGETLLLLNFEHQPAATPYGSRHAIFVNESARETRAFRDEIPPVIAKRPWISLRAFNEAGMMTDAAIVAGVEVAEAAKRMLADPQVAYIHVHNAARGCYAAQITRA